MQTLVKYITGCSFLLVFAIAGSCTQKASNNSPALTTSARRRDLAQEERNKNLVLDFYNRLFGKGDLSAIDQYIDPRWIEHDPTVADGREAFRQFFITTFPPGTPLVMAIENVIAEDDYVWLHVRNQVKGNPVAIANIFRVKNNLIVEHFDVIQPIPLTSANPHPMFRDSAGQYKRQCEFVRDTSGIAN